MKKITSLILLMFLTLASYGQIIDAGFETGLPNGWTITNNGNGTIPWAVNTTTSLANSGTSSLMVTPEATTPTVPIQQWVITSVANLNGIINPKLTFYGKTTPTGPTRNSKLEIRISTTNTNLASFTTIKSFEDYNAGAPNPISPTAGTYGFQEISLLPYVGQNIYVAFVMVNVGPGKTWNIDDVKVFEDCPSPTSLGVTNLSENAGTATWLNPGGALGFQVEVVSANQLPTGTPTYATTTTVTTQIMTGLQPNTAYDYYVRSKCTNNVFGSWQGPFRFETNPLPIALPYLEGFEAAHGWRFTNDTQVNKWVVGTATNNGGTKSLYISNDNGVSNVYTINTTSVTQAFRDIIIPAGTNEILFKFDFKGQGQAAQDYMRFWSMPTTDLPVAGTQIATTAFPNAIQIDANVNQQPTYITKSYIINVAAYAGTTRRFTFEWRNNNTVGTQGPAAIDNVDVKVIPCTAPTALTLVSTTDQTANISWTAPATPPASYDYYVSQNNTPPTDTTTPTGNSTTPNATISGLAAGTTNFVWVRSNCGVNGTSFWIGYLVVQTNQIPVALPYIQDFEGSTHGFQFSNVLQPNYWMVGNATHNGAGTKSLYITNNGQANAYTITTTSSVAAFRDFSIPASTSEINIQFDFKGMGEASSDRMKVWLVPTTFVPVSGTNITAANSGGVQIGIPNYSEVINWNTYNIVVNVAAMQGTNRRLVFEWINNNFSGTQPPAAVDNVIINAITCQAPSNIVLNSAGQNDATLSWTAPLGTNVTSYDYYITTTNVPPTAGTTPSGNVTAGTTVTIPGLTDSTQYFFWVRSNCGATDGNSFWIGPKDFYTKQVPAQLDFFDGFEGTSGFTIINNPLLPNKWVIGSAVSAAGNNSLYISNDNGTSFDYTTTTSNTVVHAYRDIQIPAGLTSEVAFSFDWRNNGENNLDYMHAWIVPVSYNPIQGTAITVANSGGTQLGGNYQLSNNWKNALHIFPGATFAGQTVRLVFEWRNNTFGGNQSPAAVDNVQVKALTCPAPTNLSVTAGSGGNLILSWTPGGTETQWELVIQNTAGGSPGNAPTSVVVVNGNPSSTFTPVVGQLYEFYVRAVCSPADKSLWAGPEQFSLFQPPACADLNILPLDLNINDDGDYILCDKETVTVELNASFDADSFKATTSYSVESIDYAPPFPFTGGIEMNVSIDDTWAPPFTLPFAFCFYGNEFSTVQVGSNGMVSFGTNHCTAGGCSPWQMPNASFPDPTYDAINGYRLRNAILGVFQDIDPRPSVSPNANINYQVLGTYPCRALVVNFKDINQYSCEAATGPQTSQIVIYEITNIIEVYVERRVPCLTHNDGKGVIGLINADGTQATIPPGRNVGTWTATNEAWRFKPSGVTSASFAWYQDGQLISNNTTSTVTIDKSTHFEAVVSYPGCGGDDLILRKGFDVKVSTEIILPQAKEVVICTNNLENPERGRISDNSSFILSAIGTPQDFKLTYYHSQADADSGTSPILDPDNYVPTTFPEMIYVRVENIDTGCYGTTSFRVREGVVPNLDLKDLVICTNYTLPELPSNQTYLMYEVLDPLTQNVVTDTKNKPSGGDILPIGFYTVYVQIESEDKCTEVFSYKVSVIPCSIPRGISPNGDGLNDFLDLTYYMSLHVKIFNRYGTEVYSHGPGYTNQWHGQNKKGDALPSGTYFYNILTPYENFTGWIQLTREVN